MNTTSYSSIVDAQEISALKEMIFRRAKERAEAMTDGVNQTYTSDIKNDVMDIAHKSFVASKNPFSEIVNAKSEEPTQVENKCEIGFKQVSSSDLMNEMANRSQQIKAELNYHAIQANMSELQSDYVQKASFTGALDFLNTQGALSLLKKNTNNFEVLA